MHVHPIFNPSLPAFLTQGELAAVFGVSPRSIRSWVGQRKIPQPILTSDGTPLYRTREVRGMYSAWYSRRKADNQGGGDEGGEGVPALPSPPGPSSHSSADSPLADMDVG